ILLGLVSLSLALGFILTHFQRNLVFFYTPAELQDMTLPEDKLVRIGGIVKEGTGSRYRERVEFVLTDLTAEIKISYTGLLPSLFREGQGMVAKGMLGEEGVFLAEELLAKHDENYMPPEVAEALKKSGRWKGEAPDSGMKAY